MSERSASRERTTKETSLSVHVDCDGEGKAIFDIRMVGSDAPMSEADKALTGLGFFAHMMDLFARHALIDVRMEGTGDVGVDSHHTIEDLGIALGQAFAEALGDKRGIHRYADVHLPMDETLARVALDLSGRGFLVWDVDFPTPMIGGFPVELLREFMQAFAVNAGITLHASVLYGANSHHMAEAVVKGVARCLRVAKAVDPLAPNAIPSTKGTLSDQDG